MFSRMLGSNTSSDATDIPMFVHGRFTHLSRLPEPKEEKGALPFPQYASYPIRHGIEPHIWMDNDSSETPSAVVREIERVVIDAEYKKIEGSRQAFIAEWNENKATTCVDVQPDDDGRIVVEIEGKPEEVNADISEIQENGIPLHGIEQCDVLKDTSSEHTDLFTSFTSSSSSVAPISEKPRAVIAGSKQAKPPYLSGVSATKGVDNKEAIIEKIEADLVSLEQITTEASIEESSEESIESIILSHEYVSDEEIIFEMNWLRKIIDMPELADHKAELKEMLADLRQDLKKAVESKEYVDSNESDASDESRLSLEHRLLHDRLKSANAKQIDLRMLCPICGSRSGDVMEKSFKHWAHRQLVEIKLLARAEGNAPPTYYGFDLYERWKEQGQRI